MQITVDEFADAASPDDGAFTLEEFCKRYGVGRTAAYEEINSGRLEARKRGTKTLIARSAARQWLAGLPRFEPRTAEAAAAAA
jgi:excisionase family DNA binding protein